MYNNIFFNSKMIITCFRHTTVYIWLPYLCKPGKESARQDQGYGEYCMHLFFLACPLFTLSPSRVARASLAIFAYLPVCVENIGGSLNHESDENVRKVQSRDLFSLALFPCLFHLSNVG